MRDYVSSGHGEFHLGSYGNGRVCFGAGPVRLHFTRQEAAELRDRLSELLDGHGGPCGCEPRPSPVPPSVAADPSGFGFVPPASPGFPG